MFLKNPKQRHRRKKETQHTVLRKLKGNKMNIWADLKYYKLHTFIIIFLMAIGLSAFMLVSSFVETVRHNYDKFIYGTYTGQYTVTKELDSSELILSDADLLDISAVDGVNAVSRRVVIPAVIKVDDKNVNATLIGIEKRGSESLRSNFGIDSEILFGDSPVIAVSSGVAEEIDLKKDDTVHIAYRQNTLDAEAAFISTPHYSNTVIGTWCITDYASALKLLGKKHGYTTSLMIYTNGEVDGLKQEIQGIVGDTGKVEYIKETSAKNLMIAPTIWQIILYVMMAALFWLICVGCSSLILASLYSRLKDIGILKTIGYSTARITGTLLAENMVMYLFAILVSVGSVIAGIKILNMNQISNDSNAFLFVVGSSVLDMRLNWKIFVLPSVICAICCMITLVFPIRKTTKNTIMDIINERN